MTPRHGDLASEADIQRAVVDHLRWRARSDVLWFACPNGGYRSRIEGAIFKGLGVVAGASDLMLLHRGVFYALELKTERGVLRQAQKDFLGCVEAAGGRAACCYGVKDALDTLTAWGIFR